MSDEIKQLEERVRELEAELENTRRIAEVHRQNSALFRRLCVYQAASLENEIEATQDQGE